MCIQVEKRARSFGAMECLIFLDGLSRLHEGMDEDRTRWMGVSWQDLGDGGLTGLAFGTITRQDLRVIRKERDAAVIVTALGDGMGVASSRLTIQIANCWNLKDVQKSNTSNYSVGTMWMGHDSCCIQSIIVVNISIVTYYNYYNQL